MKNVFPNYKRYPIELVEGKGTNVKDAQGKTYLDFTSGIAVCNLGHVPDSVKTVVEAQLNKIWHTSNLYESSLEEEVAAKIAQNEAYQVFFCNSGTEANEAAIKLARKYTHKEKIISFTQSFHGRTFGSMSATGQSKIKKGFGKLVPGFEFATFNENSALEQIDEDTAAVFIELVQGEGGVNVADPTWVQAIQAKCEETGALLIVDEIQTGIGRTGTRYAFKQYAISPDMYTLAKGLANGFPIGAMIGKNKLAEAFGPGSHGSTFGGNKIALAAAKQVLTEIDQPAFLEELNIKAADFKKQLTVLVKGLPGSEVRGKGFLLGIELPGPADEVIAACREKGLLVLSAGPNVLRILPPLTATEEEITAALAILNDALLEKWMIQEG